VEYFYCLESLPRVEQAAFRMDCLVANGTKRGDAPTCPACAAYVGGRRWLPPFRVEITIVNGGFTDITSVGGGSDSLLLSERFVKAYHAEGLTGLTGFERVEIVNVKGKPAYRDQRPIYHRAECGRTRAILDEVASGVVKTGVKCKLCRTGLIDDYLRHVLIPDTWDGEDLFIPFNMPGSIMTSVRFKRFCEEYAFRGMILIPAEEAGCRFSKRAKRRPI